MQIDPEHIARFEEALGSTNAFESLYQLAVSLRDEGVRQVEVYWLFQHFQIATSGDDPRYDAMDLIYGGPWAKGGDIFPQELTEEEIRGGSE